MIDFLAPGLPAASPLPGVQLRRAHEEDLEDIIEVCARSFPASLRWVPNTGASRRWWRIALQGDASEEWVAEEMTTGVILGVMVLVVDEQRWKTMKSLRALGPVERIVAAFRAPGRLRARYQMAGRAALPALVEFPVAALHDPKTRIFLELIATLPEAQGRGIGKSMLDLCFQRARALERSAVACVVDPANPALHLYRKLGFGITGQGKHGVNLSAPVLTDSGQPELGRSGVASPNCT